MPKATRPSTVMPAVSMIGIIALALNLRSALLLLRDADPEERRDLSGEDLRLFIRLREELGRAHEHVTGPVGLAVFRAVETPLDSKALPLGRDDLLPRDEEQAIPLRDRARRSIAHDSVAMKQEKHRSNEEDLHDRRDVVG